MGIPLMAPEFDDAVLEASAYRATVRDALLALRAKWVFVEVDTAQCLMAAPGVKEILDAIDATLARLGLAPDQEKK